MFKGSMVAIVTPMTGGVAPDSPLDSEAMAQLIEFHIENETDAIVAVGTTGESATLDEDEHCAVIRQVVEQVNGRIPVIAGTGANATSEAMRLTRHAKEIGADACLLVTPYYNKPTQEGLYQHYRTVAEAVDIPQILYNVPGRTACDMQPETVGRLAAIDNIIGLKDANTDADRVKKLRELCGEDFMLVSGEDDDAMDFMLAGGDGVISVTANVAPKTMHDLCVAATSGDSVAAHEINQSIARLHKDLFVESNPIPVKWALHRMGLIQSGIRLPLTWLSAVHEPAVTDALREAGLLN